MPILKKTILLFLLPLYLCGADFIPLDLSSGANSSFRDDLPDDKKGGWTDQGGCDMRLFSPGKFVAGNIEFKILSDQDTKNKSCIVIGNSNKRTYF